MRAQACMRQVKEKEREEQLLQEERIPERQIRRGSVNICDGERLYTAVKPNNRPKMCTFTLK